MCSDVRVEEEKWTTYEEEETQVKLDMADMILEQMVEETALVLNAVAVVLNYAK